MRNPNFAEGTSGVQQRYVWDGERPTGPTGETYDNIRPPTDWIYFWLENAPGADPQSLTGRPEAAPIFKPSFPDAARFYGDQPYSLKAFTFWRNNYQGIGQTLSATPGQEYSWSIHAHAWYSECSTKPHLPPFETDCQTPLTWANYWVRMGIDPDGGQSPWEDDIQWTAWTVLPYGEFPDFPIASPFVTATGEYITVWLQARTSHSLKHCDLYLSTADIKEKDPPPTDCIYPAFPFHRTVNVYRPEKGLGRAIEILTTTWEKYGPQTMTPSYDELPLGPSDPPRGLLSKTGRLWDIAPEDRQDFVDYYDQYYPLKDYTVLFEGEEPPPPPPPPPPAGGELISLHIQTEMEGVRDYVKDMADAGNYLGWIKLVKGFESSEWINQVSPKTKILAREINHPTLWEDPVKQAKAILDAVWDAIVRNRHIDALESTNEMFGTSNTKEEINYLVSLEVAISNEIKRRSNILLQEQGREVIGVLINAPVGNLQHGAQTKLLQPIIDTALRNGHGISYHPYFPATNNFDLTRKWMREEGYHHHLRMHTSWMEVLDGLSECPLFGTEGGAIETSVRSDNRPGAYLATNGWRSANCLRGDFDFYLELLLTLRGIIHSLPYSTQTYSLFTTGDPNIIKWGEFTVGPNEWRPMREALTS
jgi:hypothetical protein